MSRFEWHDLWASVPFVLLGSLVLVQWWILPAPSTIPGTWKHYDVYVTIYDMSPIVGLSGFIMGIFMTSIAAIQRIAVESPCTDSGGETVE